ncbi:MAG: hypothetical protein MRY74_02835 [Neomegalonema sp.]|nr:hypothetical protein [Neomegalonema sp.]
MQQKLCDAASWIAEPWFWVAASLFWGRALTSVYGAPRKLVKAAAQEPEAARLGYDMIRYRLGRGRLLPVGLSPFRWPILGAALGYAIVKAALGEGEALVIAAMLGPIFALDVLMEDRAYAAVSDLREAGGPEATEDALKTFIETIAELARARVASVVVSAVLTLAALAVMAGRT